MSAWRVAKSLITLRDQINAKWPDRRKDSDGTIGDPSHQSRTSDHNAWIKDGPYGVVSAMDITHDPQSGCDSYALAEQLLASRDARIKYIISNRKIAAGSDGPQPWVWREYAGANPHDHHVHISVKPDKAHYDNEAPWMIGVGHVPASAPAPAPMPAPEYSRTLREGARGDDVKKLQSTLRTTAVDGIFGPKTRRSVESFQIDKGLVVDGIVGPQTWKALGY